MPEPDWQKLLDRIKALEHDVDFLKRRTRSWPFGSHTSRVLSGGRPAALQKDNKNA